MTRRGFLKNVVCVACSAKLMSLFRIADARESTRLVPRSAPVWAGFGLNGSAGAARFDLTRRYVQKYHAGKELKDPGAFSFLRKQLGDLLKTHASSLVRVDQESVQVGEELLLGFVHDYEAVVAVRNQDNRVNVNKDGILFTFMSGSGLVLGYQKNVGWRVVCSFPFVARVELPIADVSKFQESSVDLLGKSYEFYCQSFVKALSRFNRWRDGFSSNYFARVVSATIGKKAQPKLAGLKIENLLTPELLGHETSAIVCDGLEIPLIPYKESDALAKRYAAKFSESLLTQDVVELPLIDLEFEVSLIDIEKTVVPSRQLGIIMIRRSVTMSFRVFELAETGTSRKKILQTFAQFNEPLEDSIKEAADDTPERDFLFFERQIYRTLSQLMIGIRTKDATMLSELVGDHREIQTPIDVLMQRCKAAR